MVEARIDHFQQLKNTLDWSEDGIISKSLTGTVLSWNRAAERILGYSAEEMIGRSVFSLFPPGQQIEELALLGRIALGERIDHFRTASVSKSGEIVNLSVALSPIHDESGNVIAVSNIVRDITLEIHRDMDVGCYKAINETAKGAIYSNLDEAGAISGIFSSVRDIATETGQETLTEYQSGHDGLIGLLNRVGFEHHVNALLADSSGQFAKLAIVSLDLDNFRIHNDTFGRAFGDKLLKLAAKNIAYCLRESDQLARFGADEFAICLSGFYSASDIRKVMERLLAKFAEPQLIDGTEVVLCASIGISLSRPGDLNSEALIHEAEEAMYEAKRKGRHQFRFSRIIQQAS